MRKLIQFFATFLIVAVFFLPFQAQAQTRTVSGSILTDDTKLPLIGATVRVKGTRRAVKTDANGHFSLQLNPGETLQISNVGFQTFEVTPKGTDVGISLKQLDNTLGEVVVTAMDQKKNPRELGYSVQTVKGSEIASTQRENFVNSLQGRVAGLTVTPTTGMAGASSGIILRGYNTLSGTNQPLFVVDGIILDNQTLNSNSQGGTGVGLASDGNNRNNDNTNRIADLNPNDIENVTILKGPEAAALYGSQAGNGAIIITTKKGKDSNGKLKISYDNNFRFQKVTRFVAVNNDYGPGSSNNIPFVSSTSTGTFTSFGPKWAPGTKFYDNLHNFFQTGFAQTHNVGLDFGKKDIYFRATGQYFNSDGIVPNNTYQKYSFKISNSTKIGKILTLTPSFSYVDAANLRPLKSSQSTSGSGGYLVELYEWPVNNNIRNYQDAQGNKNILFNANRNSDFDNPLWSAKYNRSYDKLNRKVYTLGVDLTPFKWLSFNGRFGYDTYTDNGYAFIHPESFQLTAATGGQLDNYYRTYKGYNHTITGTAKKSIGNFEAKLMIGTMWQNLETDMYAVKGTNLIDSLRTDSTNTSVITRTRLLRGLLYGLPNLNIFREIAYFGEASLNFRKYIFLTYSYRVEKASPIPVLSNQYSYPGASLSIILSDMIPQITSDNFLSYFKLRASLANTARLNDPYTNQRFFVQNFSSSTIPVTYTLSFTNNNPNLVPERQKTYEIGTEMRLKKDKITLDMAYYNTLCTNQIVQGYRASYATSAVLNTQNAASMRNEGVELALGLNAVNKTNFGWKMNFNFNHMWSKVISLPASIGLANDFYNSDTYISNVRGGLIRTYSTGTITGSTYQRSLTGQILIDPRTGIPLTTGSTNQLIADRTPDFTLGFNNSIRFKNWSLSFLWDLKYGGDIYNGTDQLLTNLGKSQRTANRSTPIVVQGVLSDGLQNTGTPTVNTLAIVPQFLSSYYTTLPDEEFIQKDVNWLRLRDVTLSYTFGKKIINNNKVFKNLSIFFTGNDLILLTNYQGADPAVNANNPGTGGVGGYGMDLGSVATPKSLSFGIKANF